MRTRIRRGLPVVRSAVWSGAGAAKSRNAAAAGESELF